MRNMAAGHVAAGFFIGVNFYNAILNKEETALLRIVDLMKLTATVVIPLRFFPPVSNGQHLGIAVGIALGMYAASVLHTSPTRRYDDNQAPDASLQYR